MQQSFKLAAAAALCATAFAAHADMTMDANLELDTTYQNKVEGASNARDSDLNMGGRWNSTWAARPPTATPSCKPAPAC